jgi:hypothetical protein
MKPRLHDLAMVANPQAALMILLTISEVHFKREFSFHRSSVWLQCSDHDWEEEKRSKLKSE